MEFYNPDGSVTPCCHFDKGKTQFGWNSYVPNLKYFEWYDMKERMKDGWIPECHICENQEKLGALNKSLQEDLQKAEKYGDSLRNKLQQLNLVKDALTDAKDLEGRMNGATAKIWRDITTDTGGDGGRPVPEWLQQPKTAGGNPDSNQARESDDTNGSAPEARTTE